MARFQENPFDLSLPDAMQTTMELARPLPINVNLWEVQNIYYAMARSVYYDISKKAVQEKTDAVRWTQTFLKLGETFNFDTGSIPGK